ncbi:lipocalin-like domain-containing protein [Nocardia harenae]|uniref:lipocalin-like domain-containing protein n=1 Tax=Nocardia harenae TaxID=358707 RepID=UPI0008345851|nr:lipocalin-like domain-containing protein [Nocardia harenae]
MADNDPARTVTAPRGLRERLVGAWRLVTFTGRTRSGRTIHLMGEHATGHLLYSADGFVSVNLMRADRPRGEHGTRLDELDDAFAGVLARTYLAYSGPYELYEERALVRHHFELCLDPDLIGTLQERRVEFFGDELELSVPTPQIPGTQLPLFLRWRRAAG